jgi:hypothetical protein
VTRASRWPLAHTSMQRPRPGEGCGDSRVAVPGLGLAQGARARGLSHRPPDKPRRHWHAPASTRRCALAGPGRPGLLTTALSGNPRGLTGTTPGSHCRNLAQVSSGGCRGQAPSLALLSFNDRASHGDLLWTRKYRVTDVRVLVGLPSGLFFGAAILMTRMELVEPKRTFRSSFTARGSGQFAPILPRRLGVRLGVPTSGYRHGSD